MSDVQPTDPRLEGWVIAPGQELAGARQRAEAWGRGDFGPFIANFAPDCEWYPTTVGAVVGETTPIRGHEGLRVFAREASEVWEYFRVETDQALRRGTLALYLGRVTARGRASGAETESPFFLLFEQNDAGEAVWGKSFVDLDEALAAAAQRGAPSDAEPPD